MKKVYAIFTRALLLSLVLTIPLAFVAQDDEGQKEKKPQVGFSPYWYIQGEIGPSWSHADFSRYNMFPDLNHTNINGGVGFGRQWTKVWSTYINLNRGFFEGEKRDVYPIGSTSPLDGTFTADYFGGDINIGVNLSNWWGGYKERLVTFAIHAGVGQAQWKSVVYDLNTGGSIARIGYDDSPESSKGGGLNDRKVALTVPLGATINFHINDKWDIYGDYAYTWMDTDIADGVTHGAMEVKNDVFSHFNIGARFKFGKNKTKKMADNFSDVQLAATPQPLEEVGDSVEVTINGTFPPKYFDKKSVMCFTPVLKYETGETSYETMNFKGEDVEGEGVLIGYSNGGSFTYTAKIPYDPAMDVSELYVEPVFYEYNGEIYEACDDAANASKAYTAEPRKLDDGVIHTSKYVRNNEIVDFAPHGYELETISTQEANIYFQVNRSNMNKNLSLNKDDNNTGARDGVMSDMEKGWVVKNLTVDGWASPEGEETFNQDLSYDRAQTAIDYMRGRVKKSAKSNEMIDTEAHAQIEVIETANGPDWNGFMKAVEASDIKDKNAIINVINSAGSSAQKEEEIRNMILIYPELERDILPPLRRAVIDVNTFEPKRSSEEIAELSTSDPSQLSLAEMLYAGTLTEDNATRRVIYAGVMEHHPKCYRGYNNAAVVELEDGNLEEAKAFIDQAMELKDDSYQVYNNLGVYYALSGDFKMAEESFMKSQELGGDVNYNMGIVSIFYGNYAEAVSYLSGYSCDYNLGLAQLLNKDYSSAEKTFKCVDPKDAEVMYLLAITASRQNDKASTLDYLGQAIDMNPEYKEKAAYDREFLKLEADPDFKALVGIAQ